jgi:hypothetical protein
MNHNKNRKRKRNNLKAVLPEMLPLLSRKLVTSGCRDAPGY